MTLPRVCSYLAYISVFFLSFISFQDGLFNVRFSVPLVQGVTRVFSNTWWPNVWLPHSGASPKPFPHRGKSSQSGQTQAETSHDWLINRLPVKFLKSLSSSAIIRLRSHSARIDFEWRGRGFLLIFVPQQLHSAQSEAHMSKDGGIWNRWWLLLEDCSRH